MHQTMRSQTFIISLEKGKKSKLRKRSNGERGARCGDRGRGDRRAGHCPGAEEAGRAEPGAREIRRAPNHRRRSHVVSERLAGSRCSRSRSQAHLDLPGVADGQRYKSGDWREDSTEFQPEQVLIGCDGVQSVVAQWLGLAAPINSGRSAVRGLAVYQEGHGLNGADQFLSNGKRGGVVPLNDKEMYWFLTSRTTPRVQDMAKDFARDPSLILREVTENLAQEFPQAYLDVVQHSDPSSLSWAPLVLRAPWAVIMGPNHKGAITVAGDAMHPMTPDLGQGGCSALEDAVVLARNIGRALSSDGRIISRKKLEEGMKIYVKERRWRVAGLVAGSYLSGWVQQGGSGLGPLGSFGTISSIGFFTLG